MLLVVTLVVVARRWTAMCIVNGHTVRLIDRTCDLLTRKTADGRPLLSALRAVHAVHAFWGGGGGLVACSLRVRVSEAL